MTAEDFLPDDSRNEAPNPTLPPGEDLPEIVSDEDAVARRRLTERALAQRDRQDLRAVLDTIEGRRVVRRLLQDFAGVLQQSYRGADVHGTSFEEGQRSVGLRLLAEVAQLRPDVVGFLLGTAMRD